MHSNTCSFHPPLSIATLVCNGTAGGPEGAANGTLAIMCGGSETTFQTVKPVLAAMGACIELMGPLGTGTATKLVNQLLVGAHAAAATEALQMAKQLGLKDFDKLLEVLANSWGQSKILLRCGGRCRTINSFPSPVFGMCSTTLLGSTANAILRPKCNGALVFDQRSFNLIINFTNQPQRVQLTGLISDRGSFN